MFVCHNLGSWQRIISTLSKDAYGDHKRHHARYARLRPEHKVVLGVFLCASLCPLW